MFSNVRRINDELCRAQSCTVLYMCGIVELSDEFRHGLARTCRDNSAAGGEVVMVVMLWTRLRD